jgi:hypothetical protein
MIGSLLAFVFIFIVSANILAGPITDKSINEIEELIKKHQVDKGLSTLQKHKAYSVLARELELYGFLDKSIEYYHKSIALLSAKEDPLEIYTGLLSVMFRKDKIQAESYFKKIFLNKVANSKEVNKKEIVAFWTKVFSKKVDSKNHTGFYGEYFKDRDIKSLLSDKKYTQAFNLLNPKGLNKLNINKKLQYDILSKLNGKRNGYFCEKMLKKYSQSSSVPMEVCRYIKKGKLKFGTLKELKIRTRNELPHLSYLVDVLEDVK